MNGTSAHDGVMYVCTGCNYSRSAAEKHGMRGGRRLWQALCDLAARRGGAAVHLEPVACLGVCTPACAVSLTAPGKYVLVFGGLEPGEASAAALLDTARLYRDSATGHIERSRRPTATRRLIARIPPPECDPDLDDDARDPRVAEAVVKPPRRAGPATAQS